MNRQELFDRHIHELARSVDSPGQWDEYAMVQASAKLRSLLLDKDPLLHQINRQHVKLSFVVRHNQRLLDLMFASPPVFWMAQDAISPRLIPGPGADLQLNRDGFLKYKAAFFGGQFITVREMILHVANVEGGVHPGKPKTPLDEILADANVQVRVGPGGGIAATMRGIADVVVTTCRPLTLG